MWILQVLYVRAYLLYVKENGDFFYASVGRRPWSLTKNETQHCFNYFLWGMNNDNNELWFRFPPHVSDTVCELCLKFDTKEQKENTSRHKSERKGFIVWLLWRLTDVKNHVNCLFCSVLLLFLFSLTLSWVEKGKAYNIVYPSSTQFRKCCFRSLNCAKREALIKCENNLAECGMREYLCVGLSLAAEMTRNLNNSGNSPWRCCLGA